MLIGKAKIGNGPYRDMTRFEATALILNGRIEHIANGLILVKRL